MPYEGLTVINEHQLKSNGRKILENIMKLFSFNVERVIICSKDFDVLYKTVIPYFKDKSKNEIVYQGKSIFRGK